MDRRRGLLRGLCQPDSQKQEGVGRYIRAAGSIRGGEGDNDPYPSERYIGARSDLIESDRDTIAPGSGGGDGNNRRRVTVKREPAWLETMKKEVTERSRVETQNG
ncbi:hypothetical protein EOD39_16857 [Acipenser ruthenus]|uniref:Uncharacterized protein n=1 Tax=Acipenser ruthenus TaxID=7906 RepID=A0A444V4Y6_ACIRT|nr:hypothetical protein EOD39_16857 [Acipenser ruthenus]